MPINAHHAIIYISTSFYSFYILSSAIHSTHMCASFAPFTFIYVHREGQNPKCTFAKNSPSQKRGHFSTGSTRIKFGSIPETLVYYKSGDCSIWSPQQRTFYSLHLCVASASQLVWVMQSVFVYNGVSW